MVGLGASAGGLEAFKCFFQSMPSDPGIAFVLIPHLDPRHESLLAELLSKQTKMRVEQVHRRQRVEPNHVYVMPPKAPLTIEHGHLLLSGSSGEPPRTPIDRFFRSLAEDQGENAISIVLSGTGTDGTVGLMAVKEHGGLTMAQASGSARYDSMPRSAIATGLVDHVLPVEEMPGKLLEYVKHLGHLRAIQGPDGLLQDASGSNLTRILQLLKLKHGHDFAHYKKNTLVRRIQRRMQVVQAHSTGEYLERLRREPKEVELLYRDFLIGVTSFFRDPAAFKALATLVLPKLLAKKGPDDTVRVWVSACATGEEAYSIAMLVAEHTAKMRSPPRVQIFATDVDSKALEVARVGRYPEGIVDQVSPQRLERFFRHEGHWFRVTKPLREMVIFSGHNVTKDPPFGHLDLLCCRNLLIYLEPELQQKVLQVYHYALQPGGYLFLGSSESLSGTGGRFRTVDKRHRIFQRKPSIGIESPILSLASFGAMRAPPPRSPLPNKPEEIGLGSRLEHILVEQFAPPSVVVDENAQVVYFSASTGKYLEPSSGAPTANVLSMARKGLRLDLRTALYQTIKTKKQVVHEGIDVKTNGGSQRINLIVRPLDELGEDSDLFLIVFQPLAEDTRPGRKTRRPPARKVAVDVTDQLEGELRHAKEQLQSTIEQLETSNEELKSSNEELMSMNEELQSANEELQTSKEELQSVNEELETVNAEFSSKIEELDLVNTDLMNLLQSTRIATLFLDNSLRIHKFTAAATDLFRLIETDIGRPVKDITTRFLHADLDYEIRGVLRTLIPVERQVRLVEGEGSYLMRIAPYRTVQHVIQGVVLTFFDVSQLESTRSHAALLAAIVRSSDDAIFTKTLEGTITSWNAGAQRIYGWTPDEVIGQHVSVLAPPELQPQGDEIVAMVRRGEDVRGLETTRVRKDGGRIEVSLTCSPVRDVAGNLVLISVIAREITEQKRTERELRLANEAFRNSNEDLHHLAFAASHDLREPLRMISNYSKLIVQTYEKVLDDKGKMFLEQVQSGAVRMDRLLTSMQEYWGIERIEREPVPVRAHQVVETAIKNLGEVIEQSEAEVTMDRLPTVLSQETPLLEVFQNLIGNALKYRRDGVPPRVHIGARLVDEHWEFSVADNGVGIPDKHRESIFLPFKRLHGEKITGSGMGLAICSRIVKRFGGRIWVESNGEGSSFKFTVPAGGSP